IRVLARIPVWACRSPNRSSTPMAAPSRSRTASARRVTMASRSCSARASSCACRRCNDENPPARPREGGDPELDSRFRGNERMSEATVHASAVLVGARAVLIRGPSGAGKSRLALELLQARVLPFTRLIGDDRVHLEAAAGRLLVRVADQLA